MVSSSTALANPPPVQRRFLWVSRRNGRGSTLLVSLGLAVLCHPLAGQPVKSTAQLGCPGSAPISFCQQTFPRSTQSVRCYERAGLSRDVPALDLSPLSCLTQLQDLALLSGEIEFIQQLKLGSLSPLAGLRSMQRLAFEETDVRDVQTLAKLTSLRTLSLHHSHVTDLQPLTQLLQLEELDLSGSPVRNIHALRGLKRLRKLDLTNTQVDDLSALTELPQLAWLGFRATSPHTQAQVQALATRMPTLTIAVGRTY